MRTGRLRVSVLIVVVWTASVATSVPHAQQSSGVSKPPTSASGPDLQKVVAQYCAGCHTSRAAPSATASGVVLEQADLTRVADQGAMWEKVIKKLRTGAMPPVGMPRPDAATQSALVSFLETTLDRNAAEHP